MHADLLRAGERLFRANPRYRFVKLADTEPVVDWDLVERAQQVAGLKGYADPAVMPRSVGPCW